MRLALDLARCAAAQGEVPVGAVVVHRGRVVGWGYNTREQSKNALDHAEIKAIDMACRNLGGWRLPECALYVTLEPCAMCAGAIINARIDRVCFGGPLFPALHLLSQRGGPADGGGVPPSPAGFLCRPAGPQAGRKGEWAERIEGVALPF